MRVSHLGKEEVCVGGVNLLAYRQFSESLHEPATFQQQHVNPFLYAYLVVKALNGLLLSKQVDIIRIFHLVEYVDDVFLCESHAESDGSGAPCLAHSVQHNEVGVGGELLQHGLLA